MSRKTNKCFKTKDSGYSGEEISHRRAKINSPEQGQKPRAISEPIVGVLLLLLLLLPCVFSTFKADLLINCSVAPSTDNFTETGLWEAENNKTSVLLMQHRIVQSLNG